MIGDRLRSARAKAGLSLDALAAKASNIVTKQAISQYEKNQKTPSSTVLIALANALGVGVEYFFRTVNVSIGSVDFRKHSSFGAKKQESLKERVKEYLERYIQVESVLELPCEFVNPFDGCSVADYADLEDMADRLRDVWGLGFDQIDNVVDMLELQNIKVMLIDDEKKFNGLSGYANNDLAHPFIVLNDSVDLSADRKRFTAIHELAHLLFEGKHSLDAEKVSDRFAGAFLFPRQSVIKEFGAKRSSISLEELKQVKLKYKISMASIVMRLSQLGFIGDAVKQRFFIQNNKAKFEGLVCIEHSEKPSRFENLLARAYSEKMISLSKLAELSGCGVDEALQQYGTTL